MRMLQTILDKHRRLTSQEETEFIFNAQAGCSKAMEALVYSVTPYATKEAWRFAGGNEARFEDAIQAALMGATQAVQKFDFAKANGGRFMNFAVRWIRRELADWADRSPVVRLPLNSFSKRPDLKAPEVVSFDAPIGPRNETVGSLLLLIPDENAQTEDFLENASIWPQMHLTLNEQQLFVMQRRFPRDAAEQPQTLDEIGRQLGLTRERVRQIEHKALNKLKAALHARTALSATRCQ